MSSRDSKKLTRLSKTSLNKTLKTSIEESIKKAFGSDHQIHIKESGPSWVNSPRGELGEEIINPVVESDFTVSVKKRSS